MCLTYPHEGREGGRRGAIPASGGVLALESINSLHVFDAPSFLHSPNSYLLLVDIFFFLQC